MRLAVLTFCLIFFIQQSESFDAIRDVRYLLLTRRNVVIPQELIWGNIESVRNSFFDPAKPTRFLIHGYFEGEGTNTGLDTFAARALLNAYDFNVIFVDWSAGAQTINYVAARRRIRVLGPSVARFIDLMHDSKLLRVGEVKIVGFSLGAHAAGYVGKSVTRGKLHTIVGLDPSRLLFDVNEPEDRIAVGDAQYVECIHTNGGLIGFGIGAPICDADFFPNGGSSQPGCITNTCSTERSVELYIESLLTNEFWANQCESTRRMSKRNCRGEPGAFMSGEPTNIGLKGIFYLETNRRSPFGQGRW